MLHKPPDQSPGHGILGLVNVTQNWSFGGEAQKNPQETKDKTPQTNVNLLLREF